MAWNFLFLTFLGTSSFNLLTSMAGLLITYVALNLMDGHGQPALLYIVPFTLGNFVTASTVNHVGLHSGLESVSLCDFKQNREKCII